MNFIEFSKSLKKQIANVYNLKGDDWFLIRQAIINLKSELIKSFEEFNFQRVEGGKLKPDELNAILMTLPIGNDYRLVVIDSPTAEMVKTINSFDFSSNNLCVACINADKLAAAEIVDCSSIDREEINKFILNRLAKSKLSIEQQALDYLVDSCSGKMSRIVTELTKIIPYASDDKIITMEMVTNLIADSTEYVIYMLTGAIDENDLSKYQKILNTMSKSQSLAEIFSYMGKYFKRMQYIALSKDDDELSKILGIKPYAIKMARKAIAKNGIKYYINLYQKYIELDYKIKSGEISANNAIYELVF